MLEWMARRPITPMNNYNFLLNSNECFFIWFPGDSKDKDDHSEFLFFLSDCISSLKVPTFNFINYLCASDSKKNQKLMYNKVETTPTKPCPKLPLKSIAEMNAGLVRSNHDRYSKKILKITGNLKYISKKLKIGHYNSA